MAKYNYVLFDADGTLFDFLKAEAVALEKTINDTGVNFTKEVEKTYSDVNLKLWMQFEKGEIDLKTLRVKRFADLFEVLKIKSNPDMYAEKYIDFLSLCTHLIDGAEDICCELYGKASLSIATNGIAQVQKSRLSLSSISKYFDDVFISEEIGCPKPKIEFFDYAFKALNYPDKEDIIIIGDSLSSDIKGGINAGIATCYYNPKKDPLTEDLKINYIIDDLSQLKDIIL